MNSANIYLHTTIHNIHQLHVSLVNSGELYIVHTLWLKLHSCICCWGGESHWVFTFPSLVRFKAACTGANWLQLFSKLWWENIAWWQKWSSAAIEFCHSATICKYILKFSLLQTLEVSTRSPCQKLVLEGIWAGVKLNFSAHLSVSWVRRRVVSRGVVLNKDFRSKQEMAQWAVRAGMRNAGFWAASTTSPLFPYTTRNYSPVYLNYISFSISLTHYLTHYNAVWSLMLY